MTEQELRQQLIKAAYEWSISSGDESIPDVVMPICKAYADAQVEASVGRQQPIFEAAMDAKNTEIAELKAQIRNYELRIDSDAVELDKRYSERTELNAEIKRLREGIQKAIDDREKSVRIWSLNEFLPVLKGLLSPAPVTEGKETANESSRLLQCCHCERMFDPSDENDFCLNGTCDAK